MAHLSERHLVALLFIFSVSVLNDAVDPGLKVQLSQTVDILTVQVQQARLPDQSGTADIKVGKVEYEFKNMKVCSNCVFRVFQYNLQCMLHIYAILV
jgi:hypothetical protein